MPFLSKMAKCILPFLALTGAGTQRRFSFFLLFSNFDIKNPHPFKDEGWLEEKYFLI